MQAKRPPLFDCLQRAQERPDSDPMFGVLWASITSSTAPMTQPDGDTAAALMALAAATCSLHRGAALMLFAMAECSSCPDIAQLARGARVGLPSLSRDESDAPIFDRTASYWALRAIDARPGARPVRVKGEQPAQLAGGAE